MLVSLEWLNQYLNKALSLGSVVSAMEKAGIEIEKIENSVELDKKIVTAKVVKVINHPNADRLRLATVSTGKVKVKVVCGAPNLAVGQKVVLALVGAKLPGGLVIKASKIRGELSNGMLCSEQELGLSDNHDGIIVLESKTIVGKPAQSMFGMRGNVIDIKTAANRPDLQSYIGIAREVAMHTNTKLKYPSLKIPRIASKSGLASVEVKDLAPRYSLARFSLDAGIGESPKWLKQRLLAIGTRPINLVVDVTNYVMSEFGQPLHAFDAAKVDGSVRVRLASRAEKVVTIDSKERQLTAKDLVIADSKKAIGIAGVMGGKDSEISSSTKEILLESATFNGTSVRKTAASQHLRSEASAHFERGLPVELVEQGMLRALALLNELVGVSNVRLSDIGLKVSKTSPIEVDLERFATISSLGVPPKSVISKMTQLGCKVTSKNKKITVTPPFWRPDLQIAEDIFEELIKIMGLDAVPANLPSLNLDFKSVHYDGFWPKFWQIRSSLAGAGLQEVSTYPFTSQKRIEELGLVALKHLKVKNPRSPEQTYLRTNLLPGLLDAASNNVRRQPEIAMFEVANVYIVERGYLPKEQLALGVIACSRHQAFETIKVVNAMLEKALHAKLELEPTSIFAFLHPSRQMIVKIGKQQVGFLGELHPNLLASHKLVSASYIELDFNSLIDAWNQPIAISPSHLPEVKRDVTLVVDQHVSWQSISKVLGEHGFRANYGGDYYDKKLGLEKRALTIRFTFVPTKKTLEEKDITVLLEEVAKLLKEHFGARLTD